MIGELGSRLRDAIKSFAGKGSVNKAELDVLIKELQRVLISSDVNVKLVSDLSKAIRKKGLDEKPLPGLTVKEHILRVVYDQLVSLVGLGTEIPTKKDIKIVLLGLYGSGKTTTASKLGYWLKKRGITPTLVSLDRDRPAAYEQLEQLGNKIGLKASKELVKAPIIIDTAGRDALSESMLKEAKNLLKKEKPEHVFLVVPAEMGHEAGKQAEAFGDLLTGVIITRMDGSAKGGGALSACAQAKVPIAFIGTGERVDDLEIFEPKRYMSRLLGWGDIKGLIEKAREIQNEIGPVNLSDLSNLNMVTFYKQLEALTKMGPFEKVLQMVGLTDLDKKTVGDMKGKLKRYKVMIDSMTKNEREDPGILSTTRIERIAKGSGTTIREVRELLKEFNMMKKMVKGMAGGKIGKKMKGMNLKALKGMKLK
ncbi:MAG: signal recognition particle protein Srp19 [Candidatus Altiarchaeota archaeon]|nr:signal recognition particle protein Srp19 [Candidatus Altiarchaeota archaeon]